MASKNERTPRRVHRSGEAARVESGEDYSTSKCFAISAGVLVVLFAVYAALVEYAKAVLC